ncbi:MAG TPA: methyltransferase domain-containing protein [Gammaproteobacteria bacterium]|nr:methyltransferase domain-containing protein [Gammaproteobacteria bacterium]
MRAAMEKTRLRSVYDRLAGGYDFRHGLLTAHSDQRGRRILVREAVQPGEEVLDCGAGTGTTGLLAAERAGPGGRVVLFDMSEGMLEVAAEKAERMQVRDRIAIETGDLLDLPFADDSFDVVLSTYSLCPVYDPAVGAAELYRVTRPGGRIGVAHSTEPANAWVRWLGDRVEDLAWHFPSISMGCRAVSVLPALEALGCRTVLRKRIGVPLWPFLVFVVEKPAG